MIEVMGCFYACLLTILLLGLKVLGYIDWPFMWTLAPVLFFIAFTLGEMVVHDALYCYTKILARRIKRLRKETKK